MQISSRIHLSDRAFVGGSSNGQAMIKSDSKVRACGRLGGGVRQLPRSREWGTHGMKFDSSQSGATSRVPPKLGSLKKDVVGSGGNNPAKGGTRRRMFQL